MWNIGIYKNLHTGKSCGIYSVVPIFGSSLRTFRCLILKHLGEIMLEEGKGRVVKGLVGGDFCEMGLKTKQG